MTWLLAANLMHAIAASPLVMLIVLCITDPDMRPAAYFARDGEAVDLDDAADRH